MHRPEFDLSCEICHLPFKHKNSLVRHMARHTGELPFRCPECDAAFPSQQRVKEHIKAKHPFHATIHNQTHLKGSSSSAKAKVILPSAMRPLAPNRWVIQSVSQSLQGNSLQLSRNYKDFKQHLSFSHNKFQQGDSQQLSIIYKDFKQHLSFSNNKFLQGDSQHLSYLSIYSATGWYSAFFI